MWLVNSARIRTRWSTSKTSAPSFREFPYTGRLDRDEDELASLRRLRPRLRSMLLARATRWPNSSTPPSPSPASPRDCLRHDGVDWHLHAVAGRASAGGARADRDRDGADRRPSAPRRARASPCVRMTPAWRSPWISPATARSATARRPARTATPSPHIARAGPRTDARTQAPMYAPRQVLRRDGVGLHLHAVPGSSGAL